jgi:hypothetical protein
MIAIIRKDADYPSWSVVDKGMTPRLLPMRGAMMVMPGVLLLLMII